MDFKFRLTDLTRAFVECLALNPRPASFNGHVQDMVLRGGFYDGSGHHADDDAEEFQELAVPTALELQGLREIAAKIDELGGDARFILDTKGDSDRIRDFFRTYMEASPARKAAKKFLKEKFFNTRHGILGRTIDLVYPTAAEMAVGRGETADTRNYARLVQQASGPTQHYGAAPMPNVMPPQPTQNYGPAPVPNTMPPQTGGATSATGGNPPPPASQYAPAPAASRAANPKK